MDGAARARAHSGQQRRRLRRAMVPGNIRLYLGKAPAGAAAGAADSIASRVKRKAPPPRLLSRPKRSCASYA